MNPQTKSGEIFLRWFKSSSSFQTLVILLPVCYYLRFAQTHTELFNQCWIYLRSLWLVKKIDKQKTGEAIERDWVLLWGFLMHKNFMKLTIDIAECKYPENVVGRHSKLNWLCITNKITDSNLMRNTIKQKVSKNLKKFWFIFDFIKISKNILFSTKFWLPCWFFKGIIRGKKFHFLW